MSQIRMHERLSVRLSFFLVAILALLLLMFSLVYPSQMLERGKADLRAKAESILPIVVHSVQPAIDLAVDPLTGAFNEQLLDRAVINGTFELLKKNRELAHASLHLLPQKQLFGFTEDQHAEAVAAAFSKLSFQGAEVRLTDDVVALQEPVLNAAKSVPIAAVRIAFSLDERRSQVRRDTWYTCGACAGILLLGLLVIMGFARLLVSRPVNALVAGALQVASGRLSAVAFPEVSGELGLLARVFRSMARALLDVIKGIHDTSRQVATAQATISGAAQRVLGQTHLQSQATTAILSSVDGVNQSIGAIDRNLEQLTQGANTSSASALQLSQNLGALMPQVDEFADFVSFTDGAMKKMGDSATQIVSHVGNLAKATDEVASSVSELESAVKFISAKSAENLELAQKISDTANDSQQTVVLNVDGMEKIAQSFSAIAQAVGNLGERLNSIIDITKVITEISDQTNLLSLNASIMAAQAGEHGKGFAVVADEIKALSKRTQASIQEISALIENIDKEHRRTTDSVTSGVASVREGQALSARVGTAIRDILDLIHQSHLRMAEIARATQEQAKGSTVINNRTHEIAQMGQLIHESTGEQNRQVEYSAVLVGKIATALENVRAGLKQEAAGSAQVAEQIAATHTMAESIRRESGGQRERANQIATEMATIRKTSEQVLSDTQAVVGALGDLGNEIELMTKAIERFAV
ncbi:MAG: HAMP domain-containing protein [Deltaproteobacteria bacterium]|nr:HAMP domain-containing protein [Deltaproteobacteria bacterium]